MIRTYALLVMLFTPAFAMAQSIGTFRWQQQPYCNVLSLAVTQNGAVYELEGTDDQCGAGQAASTSGTAFFNPDGSIGFGLAIVTAPGGIPVHVDASISLSTLGGTWRDSRGGNGAFVFTPGASAGGSPRPAPSSNLLPQAQSGAFLFQNNSGFAAVGTSGAGAIPITGAGTHLMWYPGKAAFRAGGVGAAQWSDANIGIGSVAMGVNTTASGDKAFAMGDAAKATSLGSVAMGVNTTASGAKAFAMGDAAQASGAAGVAMGANSQAVGIGSVAMGVNTTASGDKAFAMGDAAKAIGIASVALGQSTQAIGGWSVALGLSTTVTGAHAMAMGDVAEALASNSLALGRFARTEGLESVAMGLRVTSAGNGSIVLGSDAATTTAASGTFLFADRSTTTDFIGSAPNEFGVRAAGGVYLYTSSNLGTGCWLPGGSGVWACASDRNRKEHFEPVDGEAVLTKLRAMPIERWSYRTERGVVHVGPMAQDFHAAFGLGVDDKTIGHLDLSGISLRAIQALEERTRALNETLARENDALKAALVALQERLDRLEAKQ